MLLLKYPTDFKPNHLWGKNWSIKNQVIQKSRKFANYWRLKICLKSSVYNKSPKKFISKIITFFTTRCRCNLLWILAGWLMRFKFQERRKGKNDSTTNPSNKRIEIKWQKNTRKEKRINKQYYLVSDQVITFTFSVLEHFLVTVQVRRDVFGHHRLDDSNLEKKMKEQNYYIVSINFCFAPWKKLFSQIKFF